jgi:hypothetical protein
MSHLSLRLWCQLSRKFRMGSPSRRRSRYRCLDFDSISPATKNPWGNVRMAASASTIISRKDFGLTWNAALETGGVLVGAT